MSKRKALVCDDGELNRTAAKSFLGIMGFDVTTAEDGLIGWETLQRESFDLVFSDVEMPNMNGFELLAKIKSDSRFSSTPVIICTTLGSPEHLEKTKKLGASFHIVKPFKRDAMQAALTAAGLL